MLKFISENWQSVSMVIGGAITWIFRRPLAKWTLKQNKANVKSTEASTNSTTIDNLEKSMNIYVAMIDDLKKELKEKRKELENTYNKMQELKVKLEEFKIRLENCK